MKLSLKVFPVRVFLLVFALVLFLSAGSGSAQQANKQKSTRAQKSNSGRRQAIIAANGEFAAAFARGDGAGVAALYSDDAELLQPHGNIIRGRSAIQTFWQGAIDSGLKQVQLETIEVHGAGGTTAEVGTYSLLGGNGQVLDSGKYVVLWKREKGKWRLYRDIWNSNAPARS
jgi:uncharacterized protein (TIGR02246 family)